MWQDACSSWSSRTREHILTTGKRCLKKEGGFSSFDRLVFNSEWIEWTKTKRQGRLIRISHDNKDQQGVIPMMRSNRSDVKRFRSKLINYDGKWNSNSYPLRFVFIYRNLLIFFFSLFPMRKLKIISFIIIHVGSKRNKLVSTHRFKFVGTVTNKTNFNTFALIKINPNRLG